MVPSRWLARKCHMQRRVQWSQWSQAARRRCRYKVAVVPVQGFHAQVLAVTYEKISFPALSLLSLLKMPQHFRLLQHGLIPICLGIPIFLSLAHQHKQQPSPSYSSIS
ncbi:hypothetical protein V6N13_064641 [Hibiscus sabdariffa]